MGVTTRKNLSNLPTLVRRMVFLVNPRPPELTHVFTCLFSERQKETAEIKPTSVTQGKTLDDDEAKYRALHAIDNDLSTVANTETDNGAGWLKLQFDRKCLIHKVIIYYRFYTNWFTPSDWCAQSESNYKACVDNHNNIDVSVYQGDIQQKSCGTLQLTYGLEQSDQIYTLICNAEGDTVKLSKSTGHLVVAEVAVISTGKILSQFKL